MESEKNRSIPVYQCQEIESLFSHQFLKFMPDGRNILFFQSPFYRMLGGCPADRPIDILKLGGIDIPGRIEVFFDPLLGFKNNLIGYEEIDDDTCYDSNQNRQLQKNQG